MNAKCIKMFLYEIIVQPTESIQVYVYINNRCGKVSSQNLYIHPFVSLALSKYFQKECLITPSASQMD
jgi:hypothetical protein